MIRSFFILGLVLVLIKPNFLLAQDEEYQRWLKEEQQKIDNFMSEEDKKFKDFLEQEWKSFKMFQGIKFDDKPKIVIPPIFSEDKDKTESKDTKRDGKTSTSGKIDDNKGNKKPVLKENNNPFKEEDVSKISETDKTVVSESNKIIPEQKEIVKSEKIKVEEQKTNNTPIVDTKTKIEDKKPEIIQKEIVTQEQSKISEERKISNKEIETKIDLNKNDLKATLNYFGSEIELYYSNAMKVTVPQNIDNKKISKFWEDISKINYKDLINQFINSKTSLKLNDWGYVLLINDFAKKIYGNDRNSRYCFVWFIMNKSGLKCRIGFIGRNIVLFMPAKTKIFGIPYFTSSDSKEKLYVIDFENLNGNLEGAIYTYDGDYPDAKKLVDMNIEESLKLSKNEKERIVKFKYKGNEYTVNAKYNNNIIKFYENYPYTDLSVYFNYKISDDTKETLIKSLRPLIEGRTAPDAANILLRFVQVGFEYKTDDQQFGREKPLFIEEIMNYPACDCEDRSILFAFLVKDLLGLSVIGVDYPGHVATAVKFDVDVPGDFVMFKNQKYVICDPTYINAYIGMAMPQFKDGKYENLIEVR
jgi:hypothetical protein